MTENEIIEAKKGLKIKNYSRPDATAKIVEAITQCYKIRKIKPDSDEIFGTAELVYKQMVTSYNYTPEELLLACEDAIFNQNLAKPFTCSAESIIAALRTYRLNDVHQTVLAKAVKGEYETPNRRFTPEEETRMSNRLIRGRMDDIRTKTRRLHLAHAGAALYDYLVRRGKMGTDDWKAFEADGRRKTKSNENYYGYVAWCEDAEINAKELALTAKLEAVVAEEMAELR